MGSPPISPASRRASLPVECTGQPLRRCTHCSLKAMNHSPKGEKWYHAFHFKRDNPITGYTSLPPSPPTPPPPNPSILSQPPAHRQGHSVSTHHFQDANVVDVKPRLAGFCMTTSMLYLCWGIILPTAERPVLEWQSPQRSSCCLQWPPKQD